MSKTVDIELQRALMAAADTFQMNLDLVEITRDVFRVSGGATFDKPFGTISPSVIQSNVYTDRLVILLIVQLVGNLHACLIADGQEGMLTVFLMDGTKLELGKRNILPMNWSRKTLYERLAPGVKATYSKNVNDDEWTANVRGNGWMFDYVKGKNREIAGRAI